MTKPSQFGGLDPAAAGKWSLGGGSPAARVSKAEYDPTNPASVIQNFLPVGFNGAPALGVGNADSTLVVMA